MKNLLIITLFLLSAQGYSQDKSDTTFNSEGTPIKIITYSDFQKGVMTWTRNYYPSGILKNSLHENDNEIVRHFTNNEKGDITMYYNNMFDSVLHSYYEYEYNRYNKIQSTIILNSDKQVEEIIEYEFDSKQRIIRMTVLSPDKKLIEYQVYHFCDDSENHCTSSKFSAKEILLYRYKTFQFDNYMDAVETDIYYTYDTKGNLFKILLEYPTEPLKEDNSNAHSRMASDIVTYTVKKGILKKVVISYAFGSQTIKGAQLKNHPLVMEYYEVLKLNAAQQK